MPAFVWISLGVFVVCLVAGTAWVAVMGLRAWRRGRPALRRMSAESAALSERAAELERRLATLEPKTAALQRERARLSRSLAHAGALLGAVREIQTVYRVARFFV